MIFGIDAVLKKTLPIHSYTNITIFFSVFFICVLFYSVTEIYFHA